MLPLPRDPDLARELRRPPPRGAPAAGALGLAVLCGCGAEAPPRPERADAQSEPAAAAPAPSSAAQPDALAPARWRFTDQAAALGIDVVNWCGSERDVKRAILESIGQGAAWLDDDLDGRLDLYVANGSSYGALPEPPPTSRLYRARADGSYADCTAEAGLAEPGWLNGVAAADFDGDGYCDLFVTAWGPHRLYVADGQGRFTERAREAGVDCERREPGAARIWGSSAAWGDVDRDGMLDLYVCHYLDFDPANPPNGGRTQNWKGIRDAYYGPLGCPPEPNKLFRSRGDGTFEDASESSGIAAAVPSYSLGVIFTDWDQDGDADIYVANDSMANFLFVNDGSGRFVDRAGLLGVAYGEQGNAQAGMGVDAADFDADGDDDIVVTNFDDDVNTLYRNDGRAFRDVTVQVGLAAVTRNLLCWGVGFFDFDLDGDLDLFTAAGHVYPRAETDDPSTRYLQRNQLLAHDGGRFIDVTDAAGPAFEIREVSRGAAFGDYDADGDVDVFVVNLNRAPTLYRNDTETDGRWLEVALLGAGTNRGAIGARVTIRSGDFVRSAERRAGASFQSTNSPWLHFGLGARNTVDSIEVRWPAGAVTRHGPFETDRRVVIEEPR